MNTVSTPRLRARAAIRAGLPPSAFETYQIHIPSPRKATPSATGSSGGGSCTAALLVAGLDAHAPTIASASS